MAESLRGKLILASPVLRDPNFVRTVVLIAEHTDEGAMGLVLNRPAGSTVGEAVPDLSWLAGDTEPVFVGGPVAETAVIVLAEFDRPNSRVRWSTRTSASSAPTPTIRSAWTARSAAPACLPATPAGGPASSRTSSPRRPGSSSRRSARRSSPPIPSELWAAMLRRKGIATRCWRRCRPIPH